MKVMLIQQTEQLQEFEQSYNALLEKVGGIESLYYSLDWIRASVETFKELGGSLFFIVVFKDDKIVMVLPFQMVTDGISNVRRTIKFWGEFDIYARNNYQCLLAEGHQPEAVKAAVEFLKTDLNGLWDTIALQWVRMEDENIRQFVSLFKRSAVKLAELKGYYFDTAVDLDSHIGSKQVKDFQRRGRKLEKEVGSIEFKVVEEITPTDLDELKKIHTKRQQYKGNAGAFFEKPLEDRYVTDLIDLWNTKKCVRYYTMRAGGRLAAFQVMTHSGPLSREFLIAMDDELRTYSVARNLCHYIFRHETDHYQVKVIDAGRGGNKFKEDYSTDTYDLFNIQVVNNRFKSRSILFAINLLFRLRKRFQALDFLAKLFKKMIRR